MGKTIGPNYTTREIQTEVCSEHRAIFGDRVSGFRSHPGRLSRLDAHRAILPFPQSVYRLSSSSRPYASHRALEPPGYGENYIQRLAGMEPFDR